MTGRLGKYAPELVEGGFAIEVADAPLLHEGIDLADLAHLVVLTEQHLVPQDAAARLFAVLLEAHATPVETFGYDPVHGETYNCRERVFAARIGDDAGWLHVARTRREAVRVALRLRLRTDLLDLVAAAAGFVRAVADQADAHAETYLADQTYLQHAQPSTFGHYLLAFAYPVLRDVERLQADLAALNRSAGGVGSVNGGRLPYDRQRVSDLLGFDGILEHTRDAMWATDGMVSALASATSLVTTLSKLAEDLEIWASNEYGWLQLADGHSRSSVMMPQKRNPYALSMVRGEAGILIGRLTGLLTVCRTPSARSDGMIFAYGEVPRALSLAVRATRLMAGVVAGVEVDAPAMRRALDASFTQATDLAEHVMTTCGLDYRTAYEVVGAAVRTAAAAGLAGRDLTGDMLDAAAVTVTGAPLGLAGTDLGGVLDAAAVVATRTGPGGAAPDVVRAMAGRCRADADAVVAAVDDRRAAFAAAETALLDLARAAAADLPAPAPAVPEKG
ncbi:argininosuccinate lyase [Kineosporia sp. R_H_3]|uniref:argininosuccinate lyase n=1 Tax=Kineosporia sp. R_H_3 TaxID=1961848 RepID=UPI000B4B1302|nr:lyase family protein [Kineosporia sp. R_H_3]